MISTQVEDMPLKRITMQGYERLFNWLALSEKYRLNDRQCHRFFGALACELRRNCDVQKQYLRRWERAVAHTH